MKQKYISIDVAQCHDCNNCFMACKDEFVGNDWPGYTDAQPRHGHRWINIERRERGQYSRNDVAYLPLPCQHCQDAHCMKAAPDAVKRREDGIVIIDKEAAKGNKALVDSCPFGAIYWNEELNVAQKCTMCAHLLDSKDWKPGVPRCIHSCPTGSLKFYEMEPAEFEELCKQEGFEGYRSDELKNKPRVVYKNLFKYTKNFISAGVLMDGDCFENATITLKNKSGVLATDMTNFFGDFKFDALDNGEYTVDVDAAGIKASQTVVIDNASQNLGFIKLVSNAAKAHAV
jgi:Fe-S-cluster-containing dehydrogenase component